MEKYSCSRLTQITSTSPAVLALSEGRIAIVTDVGLGCDGCGRVRDEARGSHTAKPCGPDAPTLASNWRRCRRITQVMSPAHRAGDGDKKARSPGRARSKP